MTAAPNHDVIRQDVERALDEDVGSGDVTAALIPVQARAEGAVISRENGVLCGRPWFDEVFHQLDAKIAVQWHAAEGDRIAAEQTLCTLHGPARALLTGERAALNFLQLLSGTATVARRFADAIADTKSVVLDTRKTLPGLRHAQKYATRCGGCRNHRMGLYDGILIKENHIATAGSIAAALGRAREQSPDLPTEVEVEDLVQVEKALTAGADRLLLDNFSLAQLTEAVRLAGGRAALEASGGVTLETVRAIAATGVDYISTGTITKDVHALDLSMSLTLESPVGRNN